MRNVVRRKLDMASRVNEFARANPFSDPVSSALIDRFTERLARTRAVVAKQEAGQSSARLAAARRREIRRSVEGLTLRLLAKTANLAETERPGLFEQLRRGRGKRRSHAVFMAIAENVLTEAEAEKETLAKFGIPEGAIGELRAAIEQFKEASDALNAGRRDHIAATSEAIAAASELTRMADVLDGLYRQRLRNDPSLLNAWISARHTRSLPIRPTGSPPESVGDSTGETEAPGDRAA